MRRDGFLPPRPTADPPHPFVAPLSEVFHLNTRLFHNAFEGVSDFTARRQPNERSNNMIFLAMHLVDARFYLARFLGLEAPSPFSLDDILSIEQMPDFATVEDVRTLWARAAEQIMPRFATLTIEDLERPSPDQFPIEDNTVAGGLTFLLQHESYHLGQLGLLRKFFGLAASKYA
ncbi:MAG: DinB family protein [Acidobacteriota bacterium]